MNTFDKTLELVNNSAKNDAWVEDFDLVTAMEADGVEGVLVEKFTDCLSDTPMVESYLLTTLNEFLEENNFPFRVVDVDLERQDIDQLYWKTVVVDDR